MCLMSRRALHSSPADRYEDYGVECQRFGESSDIPNTLENPHGVIPEIVFLCETRRAVSRMEFDSKKLGYDCCLAVGRPGFGGGLALLRRSEVDVCVRSYSLHHIDVVIQKQKELSWRFTGIYGHLKTGMKKHT